MISVIIPTYNSDKYICEAIDSVLCQSYSDYEVIVIDDGSTDDTKKIIEKYYPTVRYFYTENNGVSSARNFGIAMAKGEFVAFLDADDIWLVEKLQKQIAIFLSDETLGMVFTENCFFDDQGISKSNADKRNRLMHGCLIKNIFLKSFVVTSTVMVRKSVFDDVGLFDTDLTVAEDDNMWMRIGMKYRIDLLDEPLVKYRYTAGSLSSDFKVIVTGVNKHIELLRRRYTDLFKKLGPLAIRNKYADLYFSEAYRDFNQGKYTAARSRFIKSYMTYPFRFKSLLYFLSTYLPLQAIEMIKGIKRQTTKNTV